VRRKSSYYVGRRYGQLVIREVTKLIQPCVADCDCGAVAHPILNDVLERRRVSCGCNELPRYAGNITHGVCGTRIYKTYRSMRSRCTCPSDTGWANYGGRGITICAGWLASVTSFCKDMGEHPGSGFSIDRIDNSAGYWCGHCAECISLGRPANCRWATASMQARNKRPRRRKADSATTRAA
jgi:hypothetical protein